MRKQLLGLVFAFVALVGNWGNAYATTTDDLVASGWNLVTEITDVENNYYLFVDAGTSAYMMAHTGTWGKAYYDALEDPILSSGALWILEGNEGATSYALKNATTERYFNSGSAGWNNYTSATNDNANYTLTLADGKYSVVSVTTNQYLGPWNNNGAVAGDGENIAANKSATGAPGFYLYSMSRTDFETKKAEWTCEVSEENPLDLTSLILNPEFTMADGDKWTMTGTSGNRQYHQKTMEAWNNNNVSITQEITGLPNGKYKVCVDMISGPNVGKNAYLYAKGSNEVVSGAVSAVASANNYATMSSEVAGNTLTVEGVSVVDGTLTLGVKDPSTGSGWIVIDNFKLYYTEVVDLTELKNALSEKLAEANALLENNSLNTGLTDALETAIANAENVEETEEALTAQYAALNEIVVTAENAIPVLAKSLALVEKCVNTSSNSTPNEESYKTAFDEAITTAENTIDAATTAEELTTAYNALESARQTYVMNAVPTEGYSFDLTFKVVNPYFTGNLNGWTGAGSHKYFGATGFDGTASFVEFCNWGANSWDASVTQTVSSLPNGVYTVKAAWQAASGGATTVTLTANGASTTVSGMGDAGGNIAADGSEVELGQGVAGWRYMSVECLVTDGTMTIVGSSAATAIHQWANFDHVTIDLTGALSEDVVNTVEAAKVLGRVIAKKTAINNFLNDAQCAANIEEAAILYNDAISDPTSVAAEDINAMIATLWADLDDYTANVLNGEFESVTDGVLDGWTQVSLGQYINSGVCAYGSGTTVDNVGIVPETDIIGQTSNNAVGISVRWSDGNKMSFTQEITLPAGKHILTYDAYEANVNVNCTFTNLMGVTVGDVFTASTLTAYEANVWTSDVIEFEMAEAGTVTLSIGYENPGVGTDKSPKLWIDNVKVYSTNVHRRANAEAGKYGTICLPFNAELPENMLLYSVAGVDSKDAPTTLYLNKETSLQAGVAYIYYSLDANDIMLQKSDVAELLDAPEASSNGLTGTFVGAIPTTETTFTGEHYYLLSQNKWVKVKNEYAGQVGVKRFRAYLDVQQIADENTGTEAVSYARSMNIGGGGANGIEEILNSLNGGDDLFYTVGGQRVSAPVKGLYIKNGKKIIVK